MGEEILIYRESQPLSPRGRGLLKRRQKYHLYLSLLWSAYA
jgi:hypothetical protein